MFILNNLQRKCDLRLDFLILIYDTVRMIGSETEKESEWQKTPYANLIRYKSSGKYFARLRVRGKLDSSGTQDNESHGRQVAAVRLRKG